MKYEVFYLIGAAKESEVEKIRTAVMDMITLAGGVFEPKETQERRRLAYKVKHETHGIFIAQRFNLEEQEKINDISTKMNLNQDILRFLISRADELPELKTKEERTAQAQKTSVAVEKTPEAPVKKKEEEKVEAPKVKAEPEPEPVAEEPAVAEEPTTPEKKEKSKKRTTDEDIDKKLEEILNI